MNLKKVKCRKCGAEAEGYIREDGAIMVLHEDGLFYNSWVWGCDKCSQ